MGPATTDLGRVFRVAAYDFGMKRTILRRLAASGIEATVFPAHTPPAEIASGGFDGVFLSNGPGDPAATTYGIDAARTCWARCPCSASASVTSCSGWRWAAGRTRCRSVTEG